MTPGRTDADERPSKRQRKAQTNDQIIELETVQRAQRTGDALSAPALSSALDKIISFRRDSESSRKKVEVVLKLVKTSLNNLPKKKTIQVGTALTKNTIGKVARGMEQDTLFRAEGFHELSVVCRPPVRVNVVGSFLLGYSAGRMADVAVEMPSNMFQSKDYLNYRYHDKRLVYLIYLAGHFVKAEEGQWSVVSLTTSYLNEDRAKPVLCVSHVDEPNVTIRLIPTCSDEIFENGRLAEDRRNIRSTGESSMVDDPAEATAGYNASIAMDSTLVDNLQTLHAAAGGVSAFGDTVLLLSAWCHRHRLRMGNFIMAAVLAELSIKKVISPRASREHMLRCAFRVIAAGILRELRMGGILLCAGMDDSLLRRCEFTAVDALAVVESKMASDDPWFGILAYLFATARGSKCEPRPLPTLFDGFIRVSKPNSSSQPSDRELLAVLKRTLVETGRATLIERLNLNMFGLIVKSEEELHRKVDTRPDECDAVSFKKFWGDKAGLRRFKDGRIIESLVWNGGLGTCQEMLAYSCRRHFGEDVAVKLIMDDLEQAAGFDAQDTSLNRAIAAFDELASVLRSLEGLPLGIRAVHATSPHLRRCGAYPIRPSDAVRYLHPLDIVASFESSGAWPDDPVAISAAKAAFYIALRSTLAGKGLHARATISFVDITLGGFAFRLRIKVDKEKKLLPPDSEQVEALIWETEGRVQHQDKIKYVGNTMMGSVARLAKQWLNSHLLLAQMGDRGEELVEVLVASVMSKPQLSNRKSTMGYFCQFLHLLMEFPWEVCPLTVFLEDPEKVMNGNDNETHDEEHTRFFDGVQERFSSGSDGKMFFAVYHSWNEDGAEAETWFGKHHAPERVIAERIVATARTSLSFIETHLVTPTEAPSLRSIFVTPTNAFDVILDLHEHLTPYGAGKGPFSGHGEVFVGMDPVAALRDEFQKSLGKFALFLMEKAGRAQIFVVWRPTTKAVVKFALKEAPFRIPDEGKLTPCKEEMVAEMGRLGQGLIANVRFPKEINQDIGQSGRTRSLR